MTRSGDRGGTPGPEKPIMTREYYSIGEVCDLVGLKAHVLRYWESQFSALRPRKNRAGNRVYRPTDISQILLLKRLLYEEKFTIEGAKQRLREMRGEGSLAEERSEVVGPELLSAIKDELEALRDLLSVPDEPAEG